MQPSDVEPWSHFRLHLVNAVFKHLSCKEGVQLQQRVLCFASEGSRRLRFACGTYSLLDLEWLTLMEHYKCANQIWNVNIEVSKGS